MCCHCRQICMGPIMAITIITACPTQTITLIVHITIILEQHIHHSMEQLSDPLSLRANLTIHPHPEYHVSLKVCSEV